MDDRRRLLLQLVQNPAYRLAHSPLFICVFGALVAGDGMLLLGLTGSGMNVRICTTNRLDLVNCRGFLQVRVI